MRILLIGSGGREHAIAWKLAQSPQIRRIYSAPGNPGINQIAEPARIDPANHDQVLAFSHNTGIDLVVIGPEQPLVAGLADDLEQHGVQVFGPGRAAAMLEGSKGFTRDLCTRIGIPTPRYRRFDDAGKARAYVEAEGAPIVVKADGLAAGKGVVVAETMAEARAAIDACFAGSFGDSGNEVLIEERLEGVEASLFALCDGDTAIPFGTAQDYKRAFDGDTGPNTGGMGAISPAPALDDALVDNVMATIVRPTIAEMKARRMPFRGVLYAGLMLTKSGPKLIEYNVRFGDPECQVLMLRLESDLLELLSAAATGRLGRTRPRWKSETAVTVVMAARGYPGAYAKGSEIKGLGRAAEMPGVTIFHAGTAMENDKLVAGGGRVLNVSATGASADEARRRAYAAVDAIDWPGGFFRRDIASGTG